MQIEIDPICIGDLGIAARGPALPVSVELVSIAATASVDEPPASPGPWVVKVHRYVHFANPSLRDLSADRIPYLCLRN